MWRWWLGPEHVTDQQWGFVQESDSWTRRNRCKLHRVTASGYSTEAIATSVLFDQNYNGGWLSGGSRLSVVSAVKFIFDSPQVSYEVFTLYINLPRRTWKKSFGMEIIKRRSLQRMVVIMIVTMIFVSTLKWVLKSRFIMRTILIDNQLATKRVYNKRRCITLQ